MGTEKKNYYRSSTLERRQTFYPTPQVETKLDKYVDDHKAAKLSKSAVVNDALKHYFNTVLHI